jgi:ABC-type multidrug transport system ATPase subunit
VSGDSERSATDGPPAGPVVEAHGVSFAYGRGRAGLESIDLVVAAGETVVLLGPNGSGKTTLLRLFARDLRPRAGGIRHGSGDDSKRGDVRVGYAADMSTHFDELTGRENARWFVRAAGGNASAADALLVRFGLADHADLPVGEYSFGMRRRIDLIEALAAEPRLVLLDEPTVGLDPDGTRVLADVLAERAATGAAIIIATNDTRIAAAADRVAFLHRGRIVAIDSPSALLEAVRGCTRIEIDLETRLREPPMMPDGASATATRDGLIVDSVRGTADLPAICDMIGQAGGRIRRIDVREPGFDDVFRKLTGESLKADQHGSESLTAEPDGGAGTGQSARHRTGPPWRRR